MQLIELRKQFDCRLNLAVPSDGSNLMQRRTCSPVACSQSTCSTLRRVEPHATTGKTHLASAILNLAVPSDGSNLMQLSVILGVACALYFLAVPSDGSN